MIFNFLQKKEFKKKTKANKKNYKREQGNMFLFFLFVKKKFSLIGSVGPPYIVISDVNFKNIYFLITCLLKYIFP